MILVQVAYCRTGYLLTYPDVSVVCAEQRFLDEQEDVVLNPLVLVEVLTDSTEAYDRGKKFEQSNPFERHLAWTM